MCQLAATMAENRQENPNENSPHSIFATHNDNSSKVSYTIIWHLSYNHLLTDHTTLVPSPWKEFFQINLWIKILIPSTNSTYQTNTIILKSLLKKSLCI